MLGLFTKSKDFIQNAFAFPEGKRYTDIRNYLADKTAIGHGIVLREVGGWSL